MAIDIIKAKALLDVAKQSLGFPELRFLHDHAVEELKKLDPNRPGEVPVDPIQERQDEGEEAAEVELPMRRV